MVSNNKYSKKSFVLVYFWSILTNKKFPQRLDHFSVIVKKKKQIPLKEDGQMELFVKTDNEMAPINSAALSCSDKFSIIWRLHCPKRAVQNCFEWYATNYKYRNVISSSHQSYSEFYLHRNLQLISYSPDCEQWYVLTSLYISVAVLIIRTLLMKA